MSDNADLLSTILEDISEIINTTLHEEDREGPEVGEKILKQIDNVLELRKHKAPPETILNATKRLNAFHMLYWKCVTEHKAAQMAKENDCSPDSLYSIILKAFMLGVYRGNRFTLDGDEYFQFMDPLTYKRVGTTFRKKGHEDLAQAFEKNFQAPLEYAKIKWQKGSELLHNQMADEVLEKFPDIKKGLPGKISDKKVKALVLKALKPVAYKYERVKGIKYY